MRKPGTRSFAALLLLLAACGDGAPADPLAAEFRAAWEHREAEPAGARYERVGRIFDREGSSCGPSVLRFWREEFGAAGNFYPNRPEYRDEELLPLAVRLAEDPDPTLDAELLEIAADEELDYRLRLRAIVVLCRPGNEAALPALAAIAADRDAHLILRLSLLRRIHRIGAPLPESLAEVLWLPWRSFALEAAAAFARTGEARAPGLVAAGLGRYDWLDREEIHAFASAARALAPGDPAIREPAEELIRAARDQELGEETLERIRPILTKALESLETDSPFAAARREYLRSDRRARELTIDGFDAIRDTPEEELDFAAGALALTWLDERWRAVNLEKLDRLARGIGRRIEDPTSPEEVLPILARTLAERPRVVLLTASERDLPFLLQNVLTSGYGSCLGLTSLYLAVGERLGLPLYAVHVPGHVFVRWDDGVNRIDVETTDGGAILTDEHYREMGVTDEDLAAGRYLRNLTKRETLGLVAVNLSQLYRTGPFTDAQADALASAERAVLLFPACGEAWLERGLARFELDAGDAEGALADIERGKALRAESAAGHVATGGILLRLHRFEEAIEACDRALRLDSESKDAHFVRTAARIATGRFDEAVAAAREHGFDGLQAEARILGGKGGWREVLTRDGRDPRSAPLLWLTAAEALLTANAFHEPEPEEARDLLAELAWIEQFPATQDSRHAVILGPGSVEVYEDAFRRYRELKERLSVD